MKLIIISTILLFTSCGYNKVCIEGHTYFEKDLIFYNSIGIKLTDSGHPIKCDEGDYKWN